MRTRTENYTPLLKLCLWLALLLCPIIIVTGLNQHRMLFKPFDLNRLKDDEVLWFGHASGRQLLSTKLHSLRRRGQPDVLITGNHAMQNFTLKFKERDFDFFNFAGPSPSIFEQMHLLRALESMGRLPKKLLVFSLLAHGGAGRMLSKDSSMLAGGHITPPFRISRSNIPAEIKWFFSYERHLDALASLRGGDMVVNFAECRRAYQGRAGRGVPLSLRLRSKLAEYLSPYATWNFGLLSLGEMCAETRFFRQINNYGLQRNGEYVNEYRYVLKFHRPYNYLILDQNAATAAAEEAIGGIRALEAFARKHGFRIAYLIPPRYEKPNNGPNDTVSNMIFEKLTDAHTIDFRRYWLETKFYNDDVHLSDDFGEILAPCLSKILDAKGPLRGRPAIPGHGRTVC